MTMEERRSRSSARSPPLRRGLRSRTPKRADGASSDLARLHFPREILQGLNETRGEFETARALKAQRPLIRAEKYTPGQGMKWLARYGEEELLEEVFSLERALFERERHEDRIVLAEFEAKTIDVVERATVVRQSVSRGNGS